MTTVIFATFQATVNYLPAERYLKKCWDAIYSDSFVASEGQFCQPFISYKGPSALKVHFYSRETPSLASGAPQSFERVSLSALTYVGSSVWQHGGSFLKYKDPCVSNCYLLHSRPIIASKWPTDLYTIYCTHQSFTDIISISAWDMVSLKSNIPVMTANAQINYLRLFPTKRKFCIKIEIR